MIIANPLYDTIFKYLMEDIACARIFLETIIEEELEELDFAAHEKTGSRKKDGDFSYVIHRIDFSAVIKTRSGERKRVLIEVQKSENTTDIVRFRKYLGVQYAVEPPLHILSIYILGFGLSNVNALAVRVDRGYTDMVTKEAILERDEFMELLGHDSYVLQAPKKPRPETPIAPIQELMELFNQYYCLEGDQRRLNLPIEEEEVVGRLTPLIKRLYLSLIHI